MQTLPERFRKEAANLASLTGWPAAEIAARMEASGRWLTKKQ
jgi:hypothetical protein